MKPQNKKSTPAKLDEEYKSEYLTSLTRVPLFLIPAIVGAIPLTLDISAGNAGGIRILIDLLILAGAVLPFLINCVITFSRYQIWKDFQKMSPKQQSYYIQLQNLRKK